MNPLTSFENWLKSSPDIGQPTVIVTITCDERTSFACVFSEVSFPYCPPSPYTYYGLAKLASQGSGLSVSAVLTPPPDKTVGAGISAQIVWNGDANRVELNGLQFTDPYHYGCVVKSYWMKNVIPSNNGTTLELDFYIHYSVPPGDIIALNPDVVCKLVLQQEWYRPLPFVGSGFPQ